MHAEAKGEGTVGFDEKLEGCYWPSENCCAGDILAFQVPLDHSLTWG